jgi:hypothetical protein
MEFMGISVGILALVATCVLLFGRGGTIKLLAGVAVLAVLGIGGTLGLVIWQEQQAKQTAGKAGEDRLPVVTATAIAILPALPSGFVLDKAGDVAAKIQVTGPDGRIFLFSDGTEKAAMESYMQRQYGAPGTPRAQCWAKEPGPWCDYR